MQTSLADKALSNIKALNRSSETSINADLFHLLTKNIQISRFVADVYSEQPADALEQLVWHGQHQAEDFYATLSAHLTDVIFTSQLKMCRNAQLDFAQIRPEFRVEASLMSLLRKVRKQHSAAIAVLELSELITVEQAMARMSILAEVLIQMAYLWSYATQADSFGRPMISALDQKQPVISANENFQNLLVLAMGKFGGYELNFSSDIDLIFFYLSAGQTQGGKRSIDNSRFFQKVGQQLIKLLHEQTADGFVFRVDMRLRPYGDSGNLVMSVEQAEDYYHEQGRGWERFAMVRARVLTGRVHEREMLEQILKPFAFRRYIDYGVIDSLRNMKEMIQREVRRRGLKGNIKLGAGGIREIEFMVQSLQLIQGGRDKRLQESNLLKVLPLLSEEKLLPQEIATELSNSYRFLRRLEHCLQQLEEKQTQQLPESVDTQAVIAKLMGYQNWTQFERDLTKLQQTTNAHFNALFGEERHRKEQQDEFYLSLWEGFISAEELLEKLPAISAEDASQLVTMLNDFRESNAHLSLSQKGAKRLKIFFPTLLEICLSTDVPVKTLKNLILILRSILKRTAYLDLLSENLPILQHLVDLVSRSEWIVKRLCESPILFDELLYPNSLYEPLQTSDLQSELQQSLLRIDENDEEQILDAIRSFKQINELRVAAALLAERLSISQVSRYLSQLAQVIIQAALNICWREMVLRYGRPEQLAVGTAVVKNEEKPAFNTGFAIIAYGKLGGNELGFNSDLDLVFLFEQPLASETSGIPVYSKESDVGVKAKNKISISRFYTRLAQKLIHFLSTRTSLGVLYEVDMRLRPSGNSGMLVSHIEAFDAYQKESAWTWEHQALVRARQVAGDIELGSRFEEIRSKILIGNRDPKVLQIDVVKMRNKMRAELDKSADNRFNVKQGIGGLVDIEFISQFLVLNLSNHELAQQLQRGELRNFKMPNNTVEILRYFRDAGILSVEDSKQLIDAFKGYMNCLNELTLVSDVKSVDASEFKEHRQNVQRIWQNLFK